MIVEIAVPGGKLIQDCRNVAGRRTLTRLPEGKYVHGDGPEWLSFPTDHAPNPFGSLPAKYGFTTMRTDRSGNIFHQDGPPVDVENFLDELIR